MYFLVSGLLLFSHVFKQYSFCFKGNKQYLICNCSLSLLLAYLATTAIFHDEVSNVQERAVGDLSLGCITFHQHSDFVAINRFVVCDPLLDSTVYSDLVYCSWLDSACPSSIVCQNGFAFVLFPISIYNLALLQLS